MEFQRETLTVNGTKVAMLTAGSGPPLLFFHGAGTWHGFHFALPWATHHRVMIPYHPGWGDSGDAPDNPTVHDYTMHYLEMIDHLQVVHGVIVHYLEMIDHLGLEKVDLVGLSMGGRIAATFTVEHRRRVRKLVVIAPAGLDVPEHPNVDFSKVPPEEIPSYLIEDLSIIAPFLPKEPSAEFQAARAREGASFNRLLRAGLIGPWLARWLHRVNMPALVVWGDKDRVVPVGQADEWAKLLPHAQVRRFPGAGHLVMDERPEAVEAVSQFLRS